MYIVVLSGMCSCKQQGCTKLNASALLMCMVALCWLSIFLWWIAAQGERDIGNAWLGYDLVYTINNVAIDLGTALLYTSVCDTVFSGDDVAGWRHCINITFWVLASASVLLVAFAGGGSLAGVDPSWTGAAKDIERVLRALTYLYSSAFVVIAHRKMHLVSLHLRLSSLTWLVQASVCICTRIHHAHHGRRSCVSTRQKKRSQRLSSKWTRSAAPFAATTTRSL